jgi:large subunit ribosomal protein L30
VTDIKVTQIKSSIGTKPKHRGTLRALGLRGIGQSNTLPDRPEIRGMIAKVPHLVDVTEDAGDSGKTKKTKATKTRSTGARGVEGAETGEASGSAKDAR